MDRTEEQKKVEALNATLAAVLVAMGFKVEKKEADDIWTARQTGVKANGESIFLSCSSYGKWRVTVYGVYPTDRTGQHVTVYEDVTITAADGSTRNAWHEVKVDSITISPEKTPEQIARDIERRFMPEYRRRLALVVKKIEEGNAYQAECVAALAKVIGRNLKKEEAERREYSFYHDSGHLGHVKVSGEAVKIEVDDLTIDQARRIVAIIREVKRER